ncbi:SWEET family sugar transporter [Floricoccus penangensis]|uniref:SWEET family sugar transporter n=1 Tax=Floricoccus penangensis TaxID=1859475 RepID=UPI00203B079D|nr:SWEET family sugar transporter [Floricoccus penangensis]URZ86613.1 hypothetical protein KIW23_05810 [Floricoccus penangensis]
MEESKKDKFVNLLGRVASTMSVLMYVSYIPQIAGNLAGNKGNPIQPFVAMVNCIVWTAYGLMQKKKDWPIVIANVPGIIFAGIAFITAF